MHSLVDPRPPRSPALLASLSVVATLLSADLAAQTPLTRVRVQTTGTGPLTTVVFHSPGPAVLKAKLLAPTPGAVDNFGGDVALVGNTLFVGAPLDDTAGENAGMVYRYVRQDGAWTLAGTLLPADADKGQYFGRSLAVDRLDDDTLIIGSPGDSDVALQRGSVYVFSRSGGVWTESAKITSPDLPLEVAWFGLAVALDDGTLVAAAPLEDNVVGNKCGNVYVFERDAGGSWEQVAKLFPNAAVTPSGAIFGSAVSIDGNRIAIGQPYLGNEFIYGRSYVFAHNQNGWAEEQTFNAPIPLGRDRFGSALVIRDGTVVIGSPRDAPPLLGSVATYKGQSSGHGGMAWSFVESGVVAPDGSPLNRFGSRLALDPGGTRLLVGASYQDDSGAAYLYTLGDQLLTQPVRLEAPGLGVFDLFGASLAIRGNWIAVGAPQHDAGAEDAGAVFVYTLNPTPTPLVPIDWH